MRCIVQCIFGHADKGTLIYLVTCDKCVQGHFGEEMVTQH